MSDRHNLAGCHGRWATSGDDSEGSSPPTPSSRWAYPMPLLKEILRARVDGGGMALIQQGHLSQRSD